MNEIMDSMLTALAIRVEGAREKYGVAYLSEASDDELAAMVAVRDVCMSAESLLPVVDEKIKKLVQNQKTNGS